MKKLDWKPYRLLTETPSPLLSNWLLCASSFMQRLKNHGIAHARIQVLRESWRLPLQDECQKLKIASRRFALVREVLIDSVEGQWMYARTVIPQMTLTGKERRLGHLKNRSLGSVLFKDPTMTRSPFELTRLPAQYVSLTGEDLWARRSVFRVSNKPLLLTEIFFPAIENLQEKKLITCS
jgi:chorismate--pyruvate lyase